MTADIILAGIALLLSILGWVYQLGYSSAKINRNEKDIATLNTEFKRDVSQSLQRLHEKIDNLPCKNPGWKKDNC